VAQRLTSPSGSLVNVWMTRRSTGFFRYGPIAFCVSRSVFSTCSACSVAVSAYARSCAIDSWRKRCQHVRNYPKNDAK